MKHLRMGGGCAVLAWLLLACGSSGEGGPSAAGVDPAGDADADGISNEQEGGEDTDGDGIPDYLDLDSDADGIPDRDEVDASGVRDTDLDGIPDFQDPDSDGDGLSDTDELSSDFSLVDTDSDGVPDHLDLDSDGDGVLDAQEGLRDRDDDRIPNFRDADSDGDGIADSLEAGDADLSTLPLDSDGDGVADFLDLDSDGDFLSDADEDPNGNGIRDPGESSPTSGDTDGDGTPDLIETVAGSDPGDPAASIPPGDFYFVLPYNGPRGDGELAFATDVRKADVFISMDTTGSFGEEIDAVRQTIEDVIVPGIGERIADPAFGVGRFEDLPLEPFGLPGDRPYELLQPITTSVEALKTGLDLLNPTGGGLDTPEAGFEALYQWATGIGLPDFGMLPFSRGGIGGVGFRQDSLPIVVHVTDARSHAAADYSTVSSGMHGQDQAVTALTSIGARVIGVDSLENAETEDDPRAQLEQLAEATRALIAPDPATGTCLTGLGGSSHEAKTVGGEARCPLVFDVAPDGGGLGPLIVDAVVQLAEQAALDVSTRRVGKTVGLRGENVAAGFTTADFVKRVTPVGPAPAGARIESDAFLGVVPGTGVAFTLDAHNDFQPSTPVDQLFDLDIQVLGDLVTVLDLRRVFVIVPRAVTIIR